MYELEIKRVIDEIISRKARRVMLQLPDGLRPYAFHLAEVIRKGSGAEIIHSADSCYGACDLASSQAEEIGADLLIHYGHGSFGIKSSVPVIYVIARVVIDVKAIVEAAVPYLAGWKRVGLTSTIQHTNHLKEIVEKLGMKGVEALIGECGGGIQEDGQVLGCNYSTAISLRNEVDGFIFVGGGEFHPLGLALSSGKTVVTVNPYNGSVSVIGESELMLVAKKRVAAINYAKSAETWGVFVSTKPGQLALGLGEQIINKLRTSGKRAELLFLNEVRAEHLNNFSEAKAFVDTACPRIAIDGVPGVVAPILTPIEVDVVLGIRRWEDIWGHGYIP